MNAAAPTSPRTRRNSFRAAVSWPLIAAGAVALLAAALSILVSLQARQAASPNLPSQGKRAIEAKVKIPLPPFSLTDTQGQRFDSASMRGSVWLVDFIFTRCPGPCKAMTAQMAAIAAARASDAQLRFLTITVDPDYDTPEVLAAHAREIGADPARWTFLTGPKNEVYRIIRDNFKLPVEELQTPGEHGPIAHSTRFVLIDSRTNISGYYDGLHPEGRRRLAHALDQLLDQKNQ